MKKTHVLLLIVLLLIFISLRFVFKSIDEKDLYATYIAKYSFGTEKLVLKEGGQYIQEVFIKDKSQSKPRYLTCKGVWRYSSRDKYVELENALAIADPSGGLNEKYDVPVDGVVLCKVRRNFPDIRLGTAYEDVYFIGEKRDAGKKRK
jgi:hypothetical protein